MTFKGKVVLIVGASSGMGRGIAIKLAAEGASVVLTARRKDRLDALERDISARGGSCATFQADAGDEQLAEGVVESCVQRFGRIDVLLMNAGGAPALDMRAMRAAEVNAYMRSNYTVLVNYLFPAMQQMIRQGGGVVAHTNSLAGLLGVPLQGPYSAAKGAARLLMDTCRIEFGQYGIKFLSIYPGFVATESTRNDGMPTPLEISEERAVEYMLDALRRERTDYMFPPSTSWLIRLALIMPKPLTSWVLRRSMPPLPALEELPGWQDDRGKSHRRVQPIKSGAAAS